LFFKEAKVLNHAKNPCSHLKDFVLDTEGMARCFRMCRDLDARGFHKSTWRFWIKKNHILTVVVLHLSTAKTNRRSWNRFIYPTKKQDQRILFKLTSSCNIQLSPEGEVNSAALYRDAKRQGIYLALWTDPKGDSCFCIYQISWIKIKKELFVNKRRQFVRVCLRTFQLRVFRGSFFLTILLQIQRENSFLPTSKQRPAKFCPFLCTFWRSYFSYR